MKQKTLRSFFPKNVRRVARLSRLPLSTEEEETLEAQLSETLLYVRKLNDIDTTEIDGSTAQMIGLENIFRDDTICPSLPRESVLSNAPRTHNGYFVVPAIFD